MTINVTDAYDFWSRLGRTAVYLMVVTSATLLPFLVFGGLLLFVVWR